MPRRHAAASEILSNPASVASPSVFYKRVSCEGLCRGMKPYSLQISVRMIIICQSEKT